MRAVQYARYLEVPRLVELPDPACPQDGVVVRVGATGVCRSDWHAWAGHDPVPLPHVPGHELAGTVEVVGAGVRNWSVGDRVTVPFVCGCGRCTCCLDGDTHVCPDQTQPGFTGPGSFADLVAVHAADTNLVRLPDGLDFVTAASFGCRLATSYRALVTHGRVAPGDWVAVHGCGGVGLSAVMVAVALGARVVAVDVSEDALTRARELGAVATVRDDDPAAAVREVTGGGAHVSSMRSARRPPPSPRSGPCAAGAGTSRSGCCSVTGALPHCRWTSWSPRSCRSTARTGCPPTSTATCSAWSRPGGSTPRRWSDG